MKHTPYDAAARLCASHLLACLEVWVICAELADGNEFLDDVRDHLVRTGQQCDRTRPDVLAVRGKKYASCYCPNDTFRWFGDGAKFYFTADVVDTDYARDIMRQELAARQEAGT